MRCEYIDAWILTGLLWFSRSFFWLTGLKTIAPDGSLSRRLPTGKSNNLQWNGQPAVSLKVLDSSKLFLRTHEQMWLIVKLSAESFSSTGRDFDTTIKFNTSTGKKYFGSAWYQILNQNLCFNLHAEEIYSWSRLRAFYVRSSHRSEYRG